MSEKRAASVLRLTRGAIAEQLVVPPFTLSLEVFDFCRQARRDAHNGRSVVSSESLAGLSNDSKKQDRGPLHGVRDVAGEAQAEDVLAEGSYRQTPRSKTRREADGCLHKRGWGGGRDAGGETVYQRQILTCEQIVHS